MLRDLEAPAACCVEIATVGVAGERLARQLIERAVQASTCYDLRLLLLECSCGSVAGVGKELLARLGAFGIETVER